MVHGFDVGLDRAEDFEQVHTQRVGTRSASYLGVPIRAGEETLGAISVQSIEQSNRFGEADARLLSTLAASVGVAIQNAELFAAQRQAEERFRRLVEELPMAVYTDKPDATATSTYISPRVVEIFGYPRAEAVGRELADLIVPPAKREDHRLALARWTPEGPTGGAEGLLDTRVETTAVNARGEEFPVEIAICRLAVDGPPLFTAWIRDTRDRILWTSINLSLRTSAVARSSSCRICFSHNSLV